MDAKLSKVNSSDETYIACSDYGNIHDCTSAQDELAVKFGQENGADEQRIFSEHSAMPTVLFEHL
jgi:hypothetical protein